MNFQVQETDEFTLWLLELRDYTARIRIGTRIVRLKLGNPGDCRSVGDDVFEMRIFYGPGYRVYFVERGRQRVILLCGGDKSTQARDIRLAKVLAGQVEWKEDEK